MTDPTTAIARAESWLSRQSDDQAACGIVADLLAALRAASPAPPAGQWQRNGENLEIVPPPHRRYLVRRDGIVFTATPCYGLHAPWWVVKTMDGEAPPVAMRDGDEWQPAPVPETEG
jgi:hypothetical protein